MSGVTITFTPEILANAKARNVELTRDEVESINRSLNAFTTVENGKLKFTSTGFLDISEAVESMSARYGKPIEKPATSTGPAVLDLPENATATERAVAMNAAIRAGADVANRERAAQIAETSGNPWLPKWANPTRQAIITNKNPQLAERLKREAGVQP